MQLTPDQEAAIEASRSEPAATHRAIAPELEKVLYQPFPVLDHGFIRVVDYLGNDNSIVEAARVSYGKGTRKTSEDAGLIRYLMRHRHSTPFEMCEIKLHVKLPIFVARQWIRHRTANVNEYSARYSVLDREFYTPDSVYLNEEKLVQSDKKEGQQSLFALAPSPIHTAEQSRSNKQGRENVLPADEATQALETIRKEATRDYNTYLRLLNEDENGKILDPDRRGIARELARIVLPTSIYTQWYWKIDLHNLLHFISLRADPHAQLEIREYADILLAILEKWVPLTHKAFLDYRQEAVTLSAQMVAVVRRMLDGEPVTQASSGLTKREWAEMMAALGKPA